VVAPPANLPSASGAERYLIISMTTGLCAFKATQTEVYTTLY